MELARATRQTNGCASTPIVSAPHRSASTGTVPEPANGSRTRTRPAAPSRSITSLTHSAEKPAEYRNHRCTGIRKLSEKVERVSVFFRPFGAAPVPWKSVRWLGEKAVVGKAGVSKVASPLRGRHGKRAAQRQCS